MQVVIEDHYGDNKKIPNHCHGVQGQKHQEVQELQSLDLRDLHQQKFSDGGFIEDIVLCNELNPTWENSTLTLKCKKGHNPPPPKKNTPDLSGLYKWPSELRAKL